LTFHGAGNVNAPVVVPLTAAQIRAKALAKALKACKKDHVGRKRKACETTARRRYGPVKAKKSSTRASRSRTRGVKR
jgi:hypothetical protein